MIKEYGNVRKRTNKILADCLTKRCVVMKLELLSDTPFLMSNFEHFQIFLRLFFCGFLRKNDRCYAAPIGF